MMVATEQQLAALHRAKCDPLPKGCSLSCAGITPASIEDAEIITALACEGVSERMIRESTYATLMINYLNGTLGKPSLAVQGWETFERP